jgi:hypothetical protein
MLSTGITLAAPLYNAVAIVEVALKTSIMTTTLLATSYSSNKRGDKIVVIEGLLIWGAKISLPLYYSHK